jgi:hypothetical protein
MQLPEGKLDHDYAMGFIHSFWVADETAANQGSFLAGGRRYL